VALTAVNTTGASNTTFLQPSGSDVWVVNFNSAGVAYVLLTTSASNSTASANNGVPIPPNSGMMLRAPWNAASTNPTAIISAIVAAGGSAGNVLAQPGYGTGH
jgi:hypothetical protein